MNLQSIHSDLGTSVNNGFYLKTHGRSGYIYFVEDGFVVPIAIEMPGVKNYDVLVYGETEHIPYKYFPKENRAEFIEIEERTRIQEKLLQWLEDKGIRHDMKGK